MLRLWKDQKERRLLLLSITIFLLLCIVELRFALFFPLQDTLLGKLLTADSFHNTLVSLLIGVLSAYFFYLFIDFLPRVRRESKTFEVLNSLIASVLDAYHRSKLFGHEAPIPYVKKDVLKKKWLQTHLEILKNNKSNFLPLKFSMQTAYTRIEDFRHSLPLAVSLSPERALQWLVIIDKIRLFAESYDKQPDVSEDKLHLVNKNTDDNPLKIYKSDLSFRLFELIEESIRWLYPDEFQRLTNIST